MINAFQNEITLTRGDDCKINIDITTTDGEAYVPAEGETVKLYVKKEGLEKSLEEQVTLIEKTFQKVTVQEGNAEEETIKETIKLVAEIADTDTKDLETGTYKYGVKLSTADGKVYTVITPSNFIIQEGIAK